MITEAGFVHDLPDTVYHAHGLDSLSSTFARLLTEHVPAKALELRKRPATAAMNLGKAVHARILGTGPRLVVWQYDGRTKDGKAERAAVADEIAAGDIVVVTQAESDRIAGIAQSLLSHPEVRKIIESSQPEVSAFWQERGIWARARFDLLGDKGAWDLKTTDDASTRGFGRAMSRFGYHQQSELYGRALGRLDHPAAAEPVRFICVETEAPYLVQIHTPDDTAIQVARDLNNRAFDIFKRCVEADTWPGLAPLNSEPTPLPPSYFWLHDEALGLSDEIKVA